MSGATPHTAKGGIQYQRLTPLGVSGLSALGLGLSSPAPKAPPKETQTYASVVKKQSEKSKFAVDFDDAPKLPPGSLLVSSVSRFAVENSEQQTNPSLEVDVTTDKSTDTPDTSKEPVWCPPGTDARLRKLKSPMLRLHAEIVDFCRFLEPTDSEQKSRADAVERIRTVVLSIWPSARFEVHGSFATGMYLPNSDIDAVILDSGANSPAVCLKALALSLSRKDLASEIALIAKARVPIVKFTEKQSGHQFDISFDVANGPASAEIVKANTQRFPALRPLVTVLKAFLQQRALNEVYSGGTGSYALLCMVMAHLQLHDSKATARSWAGSAGGAAAEEGCLGALLIDFFELFGRRIDTDEVGVSCRAGGSFFGKRDKNPSWHDPGRPFLLSIEDPQDPLNDLGRNSYASRSLKAAFEHAFTLLTAPATKRSDFLLGRVVRLDDETLRHRAAPNETGSIAGVASDFARYAFAEENMDAETTRGQGQKRKAASSSSSSSSDSDDSGSESGDDVGEEDEDGEDSKDDEDGDSSSSSSSSSGSAEEGQVRKPRKQQKGRGGRGGRGGRSGRGFRGGRGGRGGRGPRGGTPKTPANKRRKKNEGGGKGYFAKGRPR